MVLNTNEPGWCASVRACVYKGVCAFGAHVAYRKATCIYTVYNSILDEKCFAKVIYLSGRRGRKISFTISGTKRKRKI